VGETLLLIALDAPTGSFSPRARLETCLAHLAKLLGDDPRAVITRALVHGVLVLRNEVELRREPALPDPDDLSLRWRANVRVLGYLEALAQSGPKLALKHQARALPEPLAPDVLGAIERRFHYRYAEPLSQFAREFLFEELADGRPTRRSLELAVAHGERTLALSRGFRTRWASEQLVRLAEYALCAGRYEQAEVGLDALLRPAKEFRQRAALVRAECALERGDLSSAAARLDEIGTRHADVLALRARIAAGRGDAEETDRLIGLAGLARPALVPWRTPAATRLILAGADPRAPVREK
jgi:hypothetical protein